MNIDCEPYKPKLQEASFNCYRAQETSVIFVCWKDHWMVQYKVAKCTHSLKIVVKFIAFSVFRSTFV